VFATGHFSIEIHAHAQLTGAFSMTSKAKFKSDVFEAIYSAAQGLQRAGTIDKATLPDFDESCLVSPVEIAPEATRYIGIDYCGAQTPEVSLKGLRVYCAEGTAAAQEVAPPPSQRKYWTRRGIAEWLADRLAEDVPTSSRHRPRVFVSAALLRSAPAGAGLAHVPG
jgi:hypothetical protein